MWCIYVEKLYAIVTINMFYICSLLLYYALHLLCIAVHLATLELVAMVAQYPKFSFLQLRGGAIASLHHLTLHHLINFYMGRPGFEPGTNRLKAEYSTVELATLSLHFATLQS